MFRRISAANDALEKEASTPRYARTSFWDRYEDDQVSDDDGGDSDDPWEPDRDPGWAWRGKY